MRKLMALLVLVMIMAAAGCGFAGPKADTGADGGNSGQSVDGRDTTGVNQAKNSDQVANQVSKQVSNQAPKQVSAKDGNGENSPSAPNGDLIIKSDNQVSAGSRQELVNQLDKEVGDLMNSLDKMETVTDSDLEM